LSNDILLTPEESYLLTALENLNKPSELGAAAGLTARLHEGQVEVLKPLFTDDDVDTLFLSCGRKFGKTVCAEYALWRMALTHPNGACYYVAPENEHGRKLVWDTNRLQKFMGPDTKKYIKRIQSREMKITLHNDAFIQVVGSENWQVANGLTPTFAVYDEFKVFHPKWHTEFNPNRLAKAAPLMIIGTPPKAGDKNAEEYFRVQEDCRKEKVSYWFRRSSYENPVIPKALIDREIEKLRSRGEEDVVQREYFAKIVPGGSKSIFPMLDVKKHTMVQSKMLDLLKHDHKKLDWYVITDPGTTTCFAAMVVAINPYSKQVYIIDEIYEKDQNFTTVRSIYPKLLHMTQIYYPRSSILDDWVKIYDEAAAWFANEVMSHYSVYFSPTEKHLAKKGHGISLIKDLLIYDMVHISNKCVNLYKEMEQYAKDDKGNIPKKNDHLIDCFRYLLHASNYSMLEALEAKSYREDNPLKGNRFRNPEDDFKKDRKEADWTSFVEDEYDL
jgi:hypothetical protein